MSSTSPTFCVEILTSKQRAVAEPLVRAIDRMTFPLAYRDRHDREREIMRRGVALYRLTKNLESALNQEDERLRSEGTTDELDNRWIKNLHRLETMLALLDRAKAAIAESQAVAA